MTVNGATTRPLQDHYNSRRPRRGGACGRLTTALTTALAVVAVAGVAAMISYQHSYELVTSHGETGLTARRKVKQIIDHAAA
jgi:hypothetical protein